MGAAVAERAAGGWHEGYGGGRLQRRHGGGVGGGGGWWLVAGVHGKTHRVPRAECEPLPVLSSTSPATIAESLTTWWIGVSA